LGYPPIVNILYSGGGKFQLLIGYEKDIEETLKNFQRRIEEVLLEEFGGRLGFVLAYNVFHLKDLENYHEVVKQLHDQLNGRKRRKFSATLKVFEEIINRRFEATIENSKGTKICPSCHWEVIDEEQDTCEWCERFKHFGGLLPKFRYITYFTDEKLIKELREDEKFFSERRAAFVLDNLGGVELITEERKELLKDKDYIGRTSDVLVLNSTGLRPFILSDASAPVRRNTSVEVRL